MKERVLIKQNVFTCVMFGAILAFVVYQSLFCSADMSVLAFIIAIPTFMLSVLKIFVDTLEDMNDKLTVFIDQMVLVEDYSLLVAIKKLNKSETQSYIEKNCKDRKDLSTIRDKLVAYPQARNIRIVIRFCRRMLLYIYYFIFMIMFILLLLHSELSWVIQSNLTHIDLNLITIWSLLIILFEIMMKAIVEEILTLLLQKKIGLDLSWY